VEDGSMPSSTLVWRVLCTGWYAEDLRAMRVLHYIRSSFSSRCLGTMALTDCRVVWMEPRTHSRSDA
jgi:hypothetical protein